MKMCVTICICFAGVWNKMLLDAAEREAFAAVLKEEECIERDDDLTARLRQLLMLADGKSNRRCWVPRLRFSIDTPGLGCFLPEAIDVLSYTWMLMRSFLLLAMHLCSAHW